MLKVKQDQNTSYDRVKITGMDTNGNMLGNFGIVATIWDMNGIWGDGVGTVSDPTNPNTWVQHDQIIELLEIRDPCDVNDIDGVPYHTFNPTLASASDTTISQSSTDDKLVFRDLNTDFIAESGWGTKNLLGDDRKYCQNLADPVVYSCNSRASSTDMTSAAPGAAANGWGLALLADCTFDYSAVDWAGIAAAGITDPFVVTIRDVTVTVTNLFYGPILTNGLS